MRNCLSVLFVVLLLSPFSLRAQEKHLGFRGIPVDGALERFVEEMESVGYEKLYRYNGSVLMRGFFAGYDDCLVEVNSYSIDGTDLVYRVSVKLGGGDEWDLLEGIYMNLKGLLSKKYGYPYSQTEDFYDDALVTGSQKFASLVEGCCDYRSEWRVDEGSVVMVIDYVEDIGGLVVLGYFDKVNGEIVEREILEEL